MPDLKRKLKQKNGKKEEERLTETKVLRYNKKVVIGNRFEELEHPHITHANTYETTYSADYTKPSTPAVAKEKKTVDQCTLTNRIQGEGNLDMLEYKEGRKNEEKRDKKSTTYDLSYRCKLRNSVDGNYDSVTQFGLAESKKPKWERDVNLRKYRFTTEYKESFVPQYGDKSAKTNKSRRKNEEKRDKKSTTYDLSYRCKLRNSVDGNYDSVTQFGLAESKKPQWERDVNLRKYRFTTEYKESFVPQYGDKDVKLCKTVQPVRAREIAGNCYRRNPIRILPVNLAKA